MYIFHLVVFFNCFLCLYTKELSPVVSTQYGLVQGTSSRTVGENRTYFAFRGIPYATPPLGNLRFKAPVKNRPWKGILDATKEKNKCVQTSGLLGLAVSGSEDCLYINVYTPNTSAKLPVMVWIYGGGFTFGGSEYSAYAPDFLLDKDIIFVSFNYRVGIFGFLSTGDLNCPGNWGLKDQVLALKWVNENIKYFGGDPEKVTLIGQSAGAVSVAYLLQSKKTKGLYQRAIMQSGSSLCLWGLTRTARQTAFAIGTRLGIITPDSKILVSRLRELDADILKRAENDIYYLGVALDNILNGLPIGPVQEPEHDGALITGKSHELLKTGQFNRVPIILGLNSNEAKSFLGLAIDFIKPFFARFDIEFSRLTPYDLTRNITKRITAGREIKEHYFGFQPIGTHSSETIIQFTSNDQFNRPIREAVQQMSKYTNVYYYQFGYRGSLGEFDNDYDGVGHFEEIFYIFANKANASDSDLATRKRLLKLWTEFVKHGNPTPRALDNIIWTPNSPKNVNENSVVYLTINGNLSINNNPDQSDWMFYKSIYQKYSDPPYSTY